MGADMIEGPSASSQCLVRREVRPSTRRSGSPIAISALQPPPEQMCGIGGWKQVNGCLLVGQSCHRLSGRQTAYRLITFLRATGVPLTSRERLHASTGLQLPPLGAVIDPDPDPTAHQGSPAETWRAHLEHPCRGQHRTIDPGPFRVLVEPDAILDAIIGRGAACDQSPPRPIGRRQIPAHLVIPRLAIPSGRIERLAIGSCSHPLRVAGRGAAFIRGP